jgi:tetratricopeptide (TPR) repeat protein/tRNA A-37 threonylcarbamoyl transferase component Bud32
VALKELRPDFRDNDEVRARFLLEARVTGQLEHPGIVPVHELATGGEAPFYTMRLVRGRTLSEAVADFHDRRAKGRTNAAEFRDLLGAVVSACNTLAYAHARGVVHRDLKGANVLLGPFGEVVVLDWGLAKVLGETEAGGSEPAVDLSGAAVAPTQPGLLGTPAYMAPEQARGQVERIDRRTDVFGLGALLYEVLTGRAPYPGSDRIDVLARACEGRYLPVRSVARWVPRPLEAICHRAMASRPGERYPGALELAADLKRWLSDEPTHAWREPLPARTARWVRRRQVASAALAAGVLVAVLAGGLAWGWEQRQQGARQAEIAARRQQAEQALDRVGELLDEGTPAPGPAVRRARRTEALAEAERARGLLVGSGDAELLRGSDDLVARLRRFERDREMEARLDEARLQGTRVQEGAFDARARVQGYRRAFAWYAGEDWQRLPAAQAAARLGTATIRPTLASALDDWGLGEPAGSRQRWLEEVAQRLDGNSLRGQVRRRLTANDEGLQRLARSVRLEDIPAPTLVLLGSALAARRDWEDAERVLRRAQESNPGDFWCNHHLGRVLGGKPRPQRDEAVRYLTAAMALRPDSPGAQLNLGVALADQGRVKEAEAAYREAIRLKADYAQAHGNLGLALGGQGRAREAEAAMREAIRLAPDLAQAHDNLGTLLRGQGRLKEAEAAHRQALRLIPDSPGTYTNLSVVLAQQGRLAEAEALLKEAVRLAPDLAVAHDNLGNVLGKQGRLRQAEAAHRTAIRLQPDLASAHSNLGNRLAAQKRYPEAEASLRRAIALKPDLAAAHGKLGHFLAERGRLDDALAAYRRAIQLQPDGADLRLDLASVLVEQKRYQEAEAAYRAAVQLRPRDAQAHFRLGNLLGEQKRYREAEAAFRAAISLEPNNGRAHVSLAIVLGRQGQLAEAAAAYREAARLQPGDALAYYNLGSVLAELKRHREAEAAYRQAIARKPDFAFAHNNLGLALAEQGRLGDAVAAYRRSLQLDPRNALAHFNLGLALYRQGVFTQAALALEQARRTLPAGHPVTAEVESFLRRARQAEQLDRRLTLVRSGKARPASPQERLALAELAQLPCRRYYGTSARLYLEAAGAPGGLPPAHRYPAAVVAVRAGCYQGADAADTDEGQAARWRAQALAWLRLELAALRKQTADRPEKARAALRAWLREDGLALVREDLLAGLPERERSAWRTFWAEVSALVGEPR